MQIIKVMWEGINELDIRTLTEMSEDGYLFEIDDGRIRGCSQKDRATLERMFGKTAEFRIEDIQSVSYGGIVLYENVASRNAA